MGKTYQTTVINASIDKVWGKIRDFHDLTWAPNVVTSCVPVGDKKGDQVGAQRILSISWPSDDGLFQLITP